METHRVRRDGRQDLVFNGVLIGEGELRVDMSRRRSLANYVHAKTVRIYRTQAGGLVTMIHSWINPRIPHSTSDVHLAANHDGSGAAMRWLIGRSGTGRLDAPAEKAWRQAALPGLES